MQHKTNFLSISNAQQQCKTKTSYLVYWHILINISIIFLFCLVQFPIVLFHKVCSIYCVYLYLSQCHTDGICFQTCFQCLPRKKKSQTHFTWFSNCNNSPQGMLVTGSELSIDYLISYGDTCKKKESNQQKVCQCTTPRGECSQAQVIVQSYNYSVQIPIPSVLILTKQKGLGC